jgi:hypothetical protein
MGNQPTQKKITDKVVVAAWIPMTENPWKVTEWPWQPWQEPIRKEAFLVGVADPTGGLPEDSIFLPGLQEQLTACEGPESSWIVVKALHTYNNPQFNQFYHWGAF